MGFFDIAKSIGEGIVRGCVREADRRSQVYDRAARTGTYNGRTLSDSQRQKARDESDRLRNMVDNSKYF
ncbi:hypothetical protein [Fibrobacter sp. UWEL]|uniref:hypothetical protein n=1 Tax=Fibrobacter sp. UWEL TaxID=1896209 RepID=UPI00091A2C16|nr:hypothetical protein [Fibrobacter sp. UWEL]SHK59836.1 hypothetical protein SAMN05720468_1044 [Fibrobacter sp. UWEL]